MPFNDYIYDKCITESNTLQQLKTTGRVILPPSGSPPKWKTGIRYYLINLFIQKCYFYTR